MEVLQKIFGYITFKKKDPDTPDSTNLKIMHGINRISIFMFLFCLIVLLVRFVSRHL